MVHPLFTWKLLIENTFHEIWMQLCWPKGFSFWRFICLNILRLRRSFMDQVHGVDLYFEVLYRFL